MQWHKGTVASPCRVVTTSRKSQVASRLLLPAWLLRRQQRAVHKHKAAKSREPRQTRKLQKRDRSTEGGNNSCSRSCQDSHINDEGRASGSQWLACVAKRCTRYDGKSHQANGTGRPGVYPGWPSSRKPVGMNA